MSLDFVVAIPARFASTRLPGKPLLELAGKTMVERVVERAMLAGAREVLVATDDVRIQSALQASGVDVVMTRADHPSGTERLAEVARIRGWSADTLVVNLQGDEPLAPASGIRAAAEALAQSAAPMATLATPIASLEELFSTSAVKLVRNARGEALYFSRAPIPWARDAFAAEPRRLPEPSVCLRHIGIYAYRAGFLQQYIALPPAPAELWESLEQLRVLHAGFPIQVGLAPELFPAGVDTPEDLARVRAILAGAKP
ncbi:3-deoxy-manno-octulosonate cytidylyltransferase [Ahniella affigens]|uniref:3-deoxy-manno-octulosonate cytidylyltransferase n=1 Tax=Ahniella affigens TaxID=2021234 RepID=A0A2P1PPF1_9GAMM|nr:3-deoxy-manno-octulosonate cytidylyltransferase [Ahniella affigens]AVP96702.1 3-deoxy-manno-octulosonate cytidylyltransferase [Ahniella affigens]